MGCMSKPKANTRDHTYGVPGSRSLMGGGTGGSTKTVAVGAQKAKVPVKKAPTAARVTVPTGAKGK